MDGRRGFKSRFVCFLAPENCLLGLRIGFREKICPARLRIIVSRNKTFLRPAESVEAWLKTYHTELWNQEENVSGISRSSISSTSLPPPPSSHSLTSLRSHSISYHTLLQQLSEHSLVHTHTFQYVPYAYHLHYSEQRPRLP